MASARAVASLFLALLVLPALVDAGPPRIGVILPGPEWTSALDGLREGMNELGYVEGRDLQYLIENAQGDRRRVTALTERFKKERVDLIFTVTNTVLKVVAEVTQATRPAGPPVVFGSASGPVESGIHPAYATPDTNVTGVTSASIELVGKRLEILKEVLPHVRRVALLGDRDAASSIAAFVAARETAPKLGLALQEFRVTSRQEAIDAARRLSRAETDAMFLLPSLVTVGSLTELAEAARAARLPFAVYQVEHVRKHGALLSYGSSYRLQGKQSAALVDKILKGTPPARLPIERPKLHQLILNVETAAAIGITFSRDALNRADELVGAPPK
jgi:putative ABC transport system substrate-binding protein